jgi:hypothetical protein
MSLVVLLLYGYLLPTARQSKRSLSTNQTTVSYSAGRAVDRTRSSKLLPIHNINLSGALKEEQRDVNSPRFVPNHEDSVTESESEDEHSNVLHPEATSVTSAASLSESTIDAFTHDADVNTSPSQETSQYYINSLPNTVQDFEVMFNEGGGSFPDDFSMSLL